MCAISTPITYSIMFLKLLWNSKTFSKPESLEFFAWKLMLKLLCLIPFRIKSSTKSFDLCISSHKLGAAHSWNTPVWTFCIYHFQLLINNYYLDIQGRLQWSFTKLPTWKFKNNLNTQINPFLSFDTNNYVTKIGRNTTVFQYWSGIWSYSKRSTQSELKSDSFFKLAGILFKNTKYRHFKCMQSKKQVLLLFHDRNLTHKAIHDRSNRVFIFEHKDHFTSRQRWLHIISTFKSFWMWY